MGGCASFYWQLLPPVGASLLAKNVNDNAGFLNKRGACEFFASKLAPTFLPETDQWRLAQV